MGKETKDVPRGQLTGLEICKGCGVPRLGVFTGLGLGFLHEAVNASMIAGSSRWRGGAARPDEHPGPVCN